MPIKCSGCELEHTHPADIESIVDTGLCLTCYKRQQEYLGEAYLDKKYDSYVDDNLTYDAEITAEEYDQKLEFLRDSMREDGIPVQIL